MLVPPRKNGLDSLFKEAKVFKGSAAVKFPLKPHVEVAMEYALKFLVRFCDSSFLRIRSSKVPEFFPTNFMAFFTRRFAASNAQFHGILHSADVCP